LKGIEKVVTKTLKFTMTVMLATNTFNSIYSRVTLLYAAN